MPVVPFRVECHHGSRHPSPAMPHRTCAVSLVCWMRPGCVGTPHSGLTALSRGIMMELGSCQFAFRFLGRPSWQRRSKSWFPSSRLGTRVPEAPLRMREKQSFPEVRSQAELGNEGVPTSNLELLEVAVWHEDLKRGPLCTAVAHILNACDPWSFREYCHGVLHKCSRSMRVNGRRCATPTAVIAVAVRYRPS